MGIDLSIRFYLVNKMITLEQQFIITIQLMLAAILSMIIGIDRERHNKPAGLRTHMLTGVGACLFTALSMQAFPDGDPTRVASNIVTGIGFLGAGTIIVRNNEPRSLTTAASIWSTAAIGMSVGTSAWFLAITGTILIWFILVIIHRVEEKQFNRPEEKADTPEA